MALKIVQGAGVQQVPIQRTTKGAMFFNAKTAQMLKVNIPYELVSAGEKVSE